MSICDRCQLLVLMQRKGQVNIRKGSASLQTLEFTGGDNRDRTDDLLHAMQALSQLSYTPTPLSVI